MDLVLHVKQHVAELRNDGRSSCFALGVGGKVSCVLTLTALPIHRMQKETEPRSVRP